MVRSGSAKSHCNESLDLSVLKVGQPGEEHASLSPAYAEVPSSTSVNIIGPLTVEAWIKVNTLSGQPQAVVSRIDRNTAGSGGGYELVINDTGKLRARSASYHWNFGDATTSSSANPSHAYAAPRLYTAI